MIWLVAGLPLFVALAYWLWLAARAARPRVATTPPEWPDVDVLVPVLDEARLLPAKLENLGSLDYPPDRLRIWVIDGGSRDTTRDIARNCRHPRCHVIESPRRGKAAQLTAGLRAGTASLVLVTDADTTMPPDAVRALVREVSTRADMGAVGASVVPAQAHPIERAHWAIQNRLRAAEAGAGHAGLVVAPCYLFRRNLVDGFPDDVVADDAYVTWRVAARGGVVGHAPVEAIEWRAPASLAALGLHKLRKTYAYTREMVRAARGRQSMPGAARAVLAWRLALSASLPVSALGLAVGLVWQGPGLAMAGAVLALASALLAAASASSRRAVPVLLWLPAVIAVLAAVSVGALALAIVRRPPDPHRRVADHADPLPGLHA